MHDVRGSPPGLHILNSINNIGVHLGMSPTVRSIPPPHPGRSLGLLLA